MIKNLILSFIIALSILIGGKFLLYKNKVDAPAEVEKHVDIFFEKKKENHATIDDFYGLNIMFSTNIPYPIAGISFGSWSQNDKLILLNRYIWDYLTDAERTELVAHELGHSLLHRAHIDYIFVNGTPASIMYPSLFPGAMFKRDEEYYWKELFSVKNDLPMR